MERLDRKSRQQPSVKSLRGIICQKVMKFLKFLKIKKLQKVTFAFLHTCTAFLPVLGGPNRKSAKSCTFCTLALPNRPSRTFSYVYDVFARSGMSRITFRAVGAKNPVRRAVRVRWADEQTETHLIPGTGSPMAGPGAPTDPPGTGGGRKSIYNPCGGPQAFPPHSNDTVPGSRMRPKSTSRKG